MTFPPKPTYAIVSTDRHAGVRVGAQVVYSVVRTNVASAGDDAGAGIAHSEDAITAEYTLGHPYTLDLVLQPRVRWVLYDEQPLQLTPPGETTGFSDEFATGTYEVAVEWTRVGTHKVRCFIEPPPYPKWGTAIQVATHRQLVLTPEEDAEVFAADWTLHRAFGGLPEVDQAVIHPEQAAMRIFRLLEVAEQIQRAHPMRDRSARKAYDASTLRQKTLASRLYALALGLGTAEHRRYAINALHANAVDNVALQIFVSIGREPRVSRHDEQVGDHPRASVELVDWTDASGTAYSGTYRGTGDGVANALAGALLQWQRRCGYPEGDVRFELPPPVAEVLGAAARAGRLDANKQRLLLERLALPLHAHESGLPLEGFFRAPPGPIDLAAVLDGVAIAAAVLAIAVTLAAPVPGSRVVSALLWTSAIAGGAASTVRIAARYEHDISDPTATAIDILGLASSVLMVPTAAAVWRRGAQIAVREAVVTGRGDGVLKMALVGQIGTDGIAGVLVASDAVGKIDDVLQDESRDPQTRLSALAKLVAQLTATGALVAVGAKGNLDDLAALRTRGDALLRRLGDEGAQIDLTDGVGSAGNTRRGKHVDVVDIEPPLDGRVPVARAQLTAAARARLGAIDVAQGAAVRQMLDADGVSANLLLERFGTEALDVADDFVSLWRRWAKHEYPTPWLRLYHEYTGLHGVRYFAKLGDDAKGKRELLAGGWACMREQTFHRAYPAAGHSIARHGPHIPHGAGETLEERVTKGLAADVAEHELPDGSTAWQRVASPSDRSTRFLSFVDWLDAHDSVYFALERQFADVSQHAGPIRTTAGGVYPKAAGYVQMVDIDDPTKTIVRPLGEGFQGVKDGTQQVRRFRRPNGSEFDGEVYPTVVRVLREKITFIYATMGWTGDEWILINMYPSALPKPTTVIGLEKKPNHGETTI